MRSAINKSIFILFLFLCACQRSNSLGEEDKARITEEVRTTLDNYYREIRQSGLLAEFKYLDSSREFHWTPPGFAQPIPFDSVATILKQNAGKLSMVDNSFESLTIEVVSREKVTYSGIILSLVMDTTGAINTLKLKENGVMVKRNEHWKLLSGQTEVLQNEPVLVRPF